MNLYPITSLSSTSSSAFQPRRILFPLKETSDELSRVTERLDCAHTETFWVGMTPFEMVQKIALMTENSTAFYSLTHSNPRFQCGRSLIQSFTSDFPQHDKKLHAGQKRKGDFTSDAVEMVLEDDSLAKVLDAVDIQPSDQTFHRWTPDAGRSNSSNLDLLVKDFERLVAVSNNLLWSVSSYNRVQQEFFSAMAQAGGDTEKCQIAVGNASHQMQALNDMVSIVSAANQPVLSVLSSNSIERSSISFATDKIKPSVKFQNFMTFFLIHNWKNPFPDDAMLECLANFMIENRSVPMSNKDIQKLEGVDQAQCQRHLFIIAVEKITNWLVNCRSRRWRPVCLSMVVMTHPSSGANIIHYIISVNRTGIQPAPTRNIALRRFLANF